MGVLLASSRPLVGQGVEPSAAAVEALLRDARDGSLEGCYSRAEWLGALEKARLLEVLYGVLVDTIRGGAWTNVRSPGQRACQERPPQRRAAPPPASGAAPLWFGVLALISCLSLSAGIARHRHLRRGRSQ